MQNSRLWVCWLVIGKMALSWWFDDFGCSSQIILFFPNASRRVPVYRPLFASSGSSRRRRVGVASSSGRRRVVVASLIPCLWGKLQNLSFSKVSKQVVMSFCVAGVALCHIPTCLITCRKCQNWRKSRTKCSFTMVNAIQKHARHDLGVTLSFPCINQQRICHFCRVS